MLSRAKSGLLILQAILSKVKKDHGSKNLDFRRVLAVAKWQPLAALLIKLVNLCWGDFGDLCQT